MSQIHNASSAAYAAQWQYLQSVQSADAAGASQQTSGSSASQAFDPFAGLGESTQTSGNGPCPPFSLDTMSALIAAQEQQSGAAGTSGLSPHQQKVFSELDTDGDGSVTRAELENDFGADNKGLADYVMNRLDKDGDGAISQNEFAAGTRPGGGHHHHMHAGAPAGQNPLASLLSATDGASSQSTSNPDGSSTTTISYADGSKITLDSPAAASNTGNSVNANSPQAQSQANLLEQLIRLQAQLTAPTTSAAATLSI